MAPEVAEATTVVVADDEPLMRELVVTLLEGAGYVVHEVSRAAELIEVVDLRGGEIDLLIVDVSMPGMTGPEAVEKIRESHDGLPVLYLSGHDSKRLDELQADRGPTRILQKPFETTALLNAVRQMFDGPPADDVTI